MKWKRLVSLLMLTALMCSLTIQSMANTGVNAESYATEMEKALGKSYQYSDSLAHGVRMTLFDAQTSQPIETQNWLATPPQNNFIPLGTMTKLMSKENIDYKTMFEYKSSPTDIPTTGSGGGKEWLEGELTQEQIIQAFNVTVDDFASGKYLISVEPIQEMHMGSPDYTYIGTATEVATFAELIYPTEQKANQTLNGSGLRPSANLQLIANSMESLNKLISLYYKSGKDEEARHLEKIYNRLSITAKTFRELNSPKTIKNQMGKLTNSALPKAFTIENPDKPNLGFPLVSNPPSFVDFSTIRSQGYGIGILFASCQYHGIYPHGSEEARVPDKRPDENDKKEPPCTCPDKHYCPWTGPWQGKTMDTKDPYSGPTDLSKLSEAEIKNLKLPQNQDPKKDIDTGKVCHGDPSLDEVTCICARKQQQTGTATTASPIKKDFLNEQYTTNKGHGSTEGSHYSGPDGGDVITGGSTSSLNGSCVKSVSTSFLGDRGWTANGTKLLISKAFNDSLSPVSLIMGLSEAFSQEHQKDLNNSVTAKFDDAECTHRVPCPPREEKEPKYDEFGNEIGGGGSRPCSICGGKGYIEIDCSASIPSLTYTAEETYFAKPKSNTVSNSMSLSHKFRRGNQTNLFIPMGPRETISFYPSYKMNYYPAVSEASKNIWMLASGKRDLSFSPYIQVKATHGKISALAPWSTDYEDMQENLKVIKAGNAMMLKSDPIRYEFDAYYYINDDFFKDGTAHSYGSNPQYDEAFRTVVSNFKNLHMYGNVPFTGDKRSFIANNLGLEKLVSDEVLKKSLYDSDEYPETVTNEIGFTKNISVSNFIGGYDSRSTSTFDGKSIRNLPTEIMSEVKKILDDQSGTHSWYKEDYEGIVKVHLHAEYTVVPPDNQWFEVYRGISDWISKYNDKTNPVTIHGDNLYSGVNFILGLGNYSEGKDFSAHQGGEKSYPAFKLPDVGLFGNCVEFKIRGSAFDQH